MAVERDYWYFQITSQVYNWIQRIKLGFFTCFEPKLFLDFLFRYSPYRVCLCEFAKLVLTLILVKEHYSETGKSCKPSILQHQVTLH